MRGLVSLCQFHKKQKKVFDEERTRERRKRIGHKSLLESDKSVLVYSKCRENTKRKKYFGFNSLFLKSLLFLFAL